MKRLFLVHLKTNMAKNKEESINQIDIIVDINK